MDKIESIPSQDEIKSSWDGSDVRVTVYVQCYNHEKYIEDALEGILLQRTNFPFRVVVYDDCSSDMSPRILSEYQKKYPDIVFLYLAEYNHHSAQAPMVEHEPLMKGLYVAFCDGDDYWLDVGKLQRQHDLMEMHGGNMCVHPSVICQVDTGQEDVFCYYGPEVARISPFLPFHLKNQFSPTSSYFVSFSAYKLFLEFLRKRRQSFADFFIEALSSEGGILYTPQVMSLYRRGGRGSHSERQASMPLREAEEYHEKSLFNLDLLSEIKPFPEREMSTRKSLLEIGYIIKKIQLLQASNADYRKEERDLKERLKKVGDVDLEEFIEAL